MSGGDLLETYCTLVTICLNGVYIRRDLFVNKNADEQVVLRFKDCLTSSPEPAGRACQHAASSQQLGDVRLSRLARLTHAQQWTPRLLTLPTPFTFVRGDREQEKPTVLLIPRANV